MSSTWSPRTRTAAGIILGVSLLIIIYLFRSIIPYLIIAALLAIVAFPIIKFLSTRARLPRNVSIFITYILFLIIIIMLPILFLKFMVNLAEFENDATLIFDQVAGSGGVAMFESLRTINILGTPVDMSWLVDPIIEAIEGNTLKDYLPPPGEIIKLLSSSFINIVSTVFKGIGLIVSLAFSVFITFSISYYMTLDGKKLVDSCLDIIPSSHRVELTILASRIKVIWHKYIIGQLGVCAAVGLLTWFVGWLIGLPYAMILGLIAGITEIIPNFGPIIAAIPAVIIAFFIGSTRLDISNTSFVLLVIIAYLVIQKLEDSIFTPLIQGKASRISPFVVIVSVTAGMIVGGIFGAIIAIPMVVTGKEVYLYLYAKVLGKDPFPKSEESEQLDSEKSDKPAGFKDRLMRVLGKK